MRILAIDYGDKRIGLAVSDPTGLVASPLGAFSNDRGFWEHLGRIVRDYGVEKVVIGLPLSDDGSENDACIRIREFADKVTKAVGLEVIFHDERLTTDEAEKLIRDLNKKGSVKKRSRDAVAAALILGSYLSESFNK